MKITTRIKNAFSALCGRGYQFWRGPGFTNAVKLDKAGALFSIAFVACELVKVRALSSLPVHVYKATKDGRSPVRDHPVQKLFSRRWNALTTASEGVQAMIFRRDIFGNAYVRIKFDRFNNPVALYLITASVEIKYDLESDRAIYVVGPGDDFTPAGTYHDYEILHFKTQVFDDSGVYGRSLVELAGEEMGLSIDLPKFYSAMLRNSKHFSGYFTTDQAMNKKEWEELAEQLSAGGGISDAGKTKVFSRGVYWKQNPVSVGDASLVDQQTWNLQQMCRITSIPPQKVFDLSRSTYSNMEQGQLDFHQSTVLPEVKGLEDIIHGIFDTRGEKDLYVKFDMSGILRGSYKERMEGYRIGVYAGFFCVNEVRSWEDLKRVEGGDDFLVPQAYAVRDSETGAITPIQKAGANAQPVIAEAEKRIRNRIKKDGDTERTREFAHAVLVPIALAFGLGGLPYDINNELERIFDEQKKMV